MLKIIKKPSQKLVKYGMVVLEKPTIEWNPKHVREAVKRKVMKVSKNPTARRKQLLDLGDQLVSKSGEIDRDVLGTILENFEPPATSVKGRLATHQRPITVEQRGQRYPVVHWNASDKPIVEMHPTKQAAIDIDKARELFYASKPGVNEYQTSTRTHTGKRIEKVPVGEIPDNWETDPNSPIIGPRIPRFGERYRFTTEKQVPVETQVATRKQALKNVQEAVTTTEARTTPIAELVTWEDQADAAWEHMGARASGARLWARMLKEQAPKKIPAGKDEYGKELFADKDALLSKPRAGYNYYKLMFKRWRLHPEEFGLQTSRKVGEKQRPVKQKMHYEESARKLLERMWETLLSDAADGAIR